MAKTLEKEAWKLRAIDFTKLVGNVSRYQQRCKGETLKFSVFRNDNYEARKAKKRIQSRTIALKLYDGVLIIGASVFTIYETIKSFYDMFSK